MTALVSLVVPTRNSIRTIERCLESLRAQDHAAVEIIVVDNFSDDGTADVGRLLADHFVQQGPERSAQRNAGLAIATGEVIGFIDSDMYLDPDVVSEVIVRLAEVDGVVVPEYSLGEGFLARCRAHEKALYVGNPDVEAARFFPTEVVRNVGGYREDIPAGPEDWDLADRIAAAGHRIGRTEAVIWHDDGRVSLRDMFKKKQYYGHSIPHYLDVRTEGRQRRLTRPGVLAKPGTLARHPGLTAGMVVLKTVETSGLAVGVWKGRRSQ